MPRLFAFLRAINVGGHTVTMEKLRGHFGALGLRDVETFIASGNVIFTSRASSIPGLEQRIAAGLEAVLGYPVPTFVRTEAQLMAIHRHRPFPDTEDHAAHAVMVGLVAQSPGALATAALLALAGANDRFQVNGREVYWLRRTRESDPALTYARLERALGTAATFRNRNTIIRLVEKYDLDRH
jgi:uncharacterized protein (DUF1697 family)